MGLEWSPFQPLTLQETREIPKLTGLYRLVSHDDQEVLYIGQSNNMRRRLRAHNRKSTQNLVIDFSFVKLPEIILPHQLNELENDLLGAFFDYAETAPRLQFGKW
jgi:excinuclease UvrABC nuclease subunit